MADIFNPSKLATIAQVRVLPEVATPPDLLELARKHATRPDALTAENTWFQPVTISSDQRDGHFTYMDPDTTLPNMVRDASSERGVSVLDSHVSSRQPFGRSLTGELVQYEGMTLVASWFYTRRGIQTSTGMRTDDYIDLIESGISRELSVGVGRNENSWVECNICKKNMLSWDCEHWPGMKYEHPVDLNDPEGETMESIAVGKMIDWNLLEYSFVYKGSNGESNTLRLPESKARMFASAGAIDQKTITTLERAYDIDLHSVTLPKTYALGAVPAITESKREVPGMANTNGLVTTITVDTVITDELRDAFAPLFGGDVEAVPETWEGMGDRFAEVVGEYAALTASVDKLTGERDAALSEVERLKPLAEDGESYRDDLIDASIACGIRAMAHDDTEPFPEETVRNMLKRSTLAEIKVYLRQQERAAERNAPEQGRRSRDDDSDTYALKPDGEELVEPPVTAFTSGRRRRRRP